MSSPYINHFIQPDTIIPNPADPQSFNRYSYVLNNPVRYIDPTGHYIATPNDLDCYDADGYDSCMWNDWEGGDSGDPYDEDGDGIPDIPNPNIILYPLATSARYPCDLGDTYIECLYTRAPLRIDGKLTLDPDEFEKMLMALFFDLQNRDTTPSNFVEKITLGFDRYRYDTPFWNGYFYSGEVCFNNKCYERQEVNYVAQGMWSADSGQTLGEGFYTVYQWKHLAYNQAISPGTAYWFKIGYVFYTSMSNLYDQ